MDVVMTKQEKIEAIADILEVEIEEISEEKRLEDYDTWDSVAVLSVITFMNEHYNRFPHASEIKKYKTVGDLLSYMNE